MSSKLQLTTLAALVSAALPAQAALYKVVPVAPQLDSTIVDNATEYYGTAIAPSDIALNTSNPLGCFDSALVNCSSDYALAGSTLNRAAGFSYRDEVPFAMDNAFEYIDDGYDGFEQYCLNELGYATCDFWTSTQFSGWEQQQQDVPNSLAFIETTAEKPSDSINTVINSIDASGKAVGNYSTLTSRNLQLLINS